MRKKGENSVNRAGKSAIPPDNNNDFTLGVESQTFPACCLRCPSRLFCRSFDLLCGRNVEARIPVRFVGNPVKMRWRPARF